MCTSVARCQAGDFTQPTHAGSNRFTTAVQSGPMPVRTRCNVVERGIAQWAGEADAG